MKLTERRLLAAAAAFCILAAALSLCLGSLVISPARIFRILSGNETLSAAANIFYFSRLPRTAACLLSGAALAASGAVLQQVLANKLASPGIIGVNAGAGLGLTICCALGFFSGWVVSLGAFLGALSAVGIIILLSKRCGASRTTVILAGVAINSVFNSLNESITVLDPELAVLKLEFRVGGFSSVSYARLVPAGVLILASLALLFLLCSELDLLSLGDETACGLGLNVGYYRFVFLLLAAMLAGAAVSFAGLLGFVGLIVPHFVRKLCGSRAACLLPLSALFGAGLVTACDLISRLLFAPYEVPVGIVMSLIGAPAFLMLLLRFKGGHRNA